MDYVRVIIWVHQLENWMQCFLWQKLCLNLFQILTYIFLEKCTIGGIFYISNRYSKASNKYLKSYDPKQEPKRLY